MAKPIGEGLSLEDLMAVTLASLRAAHPEFSNTPDGVLSNAITQAENRVDEASWGIRHDDGIMLLACHLAAATAYGSGGRLTSDSKNRTIYWHDYKDLAKTVGSSWRMV